MQGICVGAWSRAEASRTGGLGGMFEKGGSVRARRKSTKCQHVGPVIRLHIQQDELFFGHPRSLSRTKVLDLPWKAGG